MYGVVTEHQEFVGAPLFRIGIEEVGEERPIVAAEGEKSDFPLLAQTLENLDVVFAGDLVSSTQQEKVEIVDPRTAKRHFDRGNHERGHTRIGLYGQDHLVAVGPRQITNRFAKRGPTNRPPVQIIDSSVKGILDDSG